MVEIVQKKDISSNVGKLEHCLHNRDADGRVASRPSLDMICIVDHFAHTTSNYFFRSLPFYLISEVHGVNIY